MPSTVSISFTQGPLGKPQSGLLFPQRHGVLAQLFFCAQSWIVEQFAFAVESPLLKQADTCDAHFEQMHCEHVSFVV